MYMYNQNKLNKLYLIPTHKLYFTVTNIVFLSGYSIYTVTYF